MRLIPPIRLSTAVLLMFVAGGWIWLNTLVSRTFEDEPYKVGVKGLTEEWVATKTLAKDLQSDSALRPGFTLLKFPAVYETRTRREVYYGKGFPFWISPLFAEGNWSRSTFSMVLRYTVVPLIANILIGLALLWNVSVLIAYYFPIEEKKI